MHTGNLPWVMVFPTLVGVFLYRLKPAGDGSCLPHARGGVSDRERAGWLWLLVFPTLVGVFPKRGVQHES